MASRKPLEKETPRALEAKEAYAAMAKPRSLAKLAEQMVAAQQAEYDTWKAQAEQAKAALENGVTGEYAKAARVALNKPAPKVQTVAVVLTRLKQWSATWGWQKYVTERDQAAMTEEKRRRGEALTAMNAEEARLGNLVAKRSLGRLEDLIKIDEEAYGEWQVAVAVMRKAAEKARAEGNLDRYIAIISDLPRRPKPYVGAYTLLQMAALGLEVRRVGTEALTQLVESEAEATLPPEVTVNIIDSPPTEPVDPADFTSENAPPPLPPDAGDPSDSPMALIGFPGAPPPSEDELEDDGWGRF